MDEKKKHKMLNCDCSGTHGPINSLATGITANSLGNVNMPAGYIWLPDV